MSTKIYPDSGVEDVVAYLLRSDLIDETGRLKETFSISSDKKIEVTQQDICEIQLAKSAIDIGLLPFEMADRIYPVGNSAGIGALQYLKSDEFEKKINKSLEKSQYIELSNLDEFSTGFALNMNFVKSRL